MSVRNLVPRAPQIQGETSIRRELEKYAPEALDRISAWIDNETEFLSREFPRGPVPSGPIAVTVVAQADSIRVSWKGEHTAAAVVGFCVWRAAAGTVGTPTTPTTDSALRKATMPSFGLDCSLPIGSEFSWFDAEFSAADRAAGDKKRYAYWVSAIDNEGRESPKSPGSAIVAVP